MKIKVIDLFNKIAYGEEVPKKIKCLGIIYEYSETDKFYYTENGFSLYREMITEGNCLDDEIEIIEEDKEIEHIKLKYWSDEESTPEQRINVCMTKIDELINVVNELKKGK